jgi:methyl-accepting chemotaxis protein
MEQKQYYKRRIYLINKKLQFRYLFIILSIMLITVVTVYSTTFLIIWNNVINAFFLVPGAQKKLAEIFIRTSQIMVAPILLLTAVFSIAGIFLSHKVAGPLYRIERVAEELGRGNLDIKVKFRKGDELHDLADKLNLMIGGIKGMVFEDKKLVGSLHAIAEKLQQDVTKQKGLKNDVKTAIRKLNTIVQKLKKSTDRFKT